MAEPPAFRRTFFLAYGLGALLCVAGPTVLQILLGATPRPGLLPPSRLAEDLGYTFTGLMFLAGLFLHRRSGKVRAAFSSQAAPVRSRVMAREILLYSAVCESGVLFGLLCHALGGPQAERHARAFIALATLMFLVFVPRLGAWRKAAAGPGP